MEEAAKWVTLPRPTICTKCDRRRRRSLLQTADARSGFRTTISFRMS
jgi:hypothetical protein